MSKEIVVTANTPATVQTDQDGIARLVVEVPNIDDHSVCEEDYDRLKDEFNRLADVFRSLAYYADAKRMAMHCRKVGKVSTACSIEREMEKTYRELPEWAQW